MSKYTKIFTTPYVPKYGPVPLSEVGQMMKERKQVIDASILQDEQTMAMLDQVSMGLNEDEKNTLLSSVEPYYKDAQSRIQSGDYNLRDIDLQTRRDATRIAGIVQGFQGLKEQKQKDIENFYKLNKDADPIQLQAMLSTAKMPTIKMDEETGLPTLSHSIGNLKIPEFEEQPEQNYGVLDPIPIEPLLEEAGIPKDPWAESLTKPRAGVAYLPGSYYSPFARIGKEDALESPERKTQNNLLRIIEDSIREANPNMSETDLSTEMKSAYNRFIEKTGQIEGAPYRMYTGEEIDDVRKMYIDNMAINSKEFFIPETGERLNIEQFYSKYGKKVGAKTLKDFRDEISLEGDVEDQTGLYTLSGKGIYGSIGGINFVMDTEIAEPLTMETRQKTSEITNPYNLNPVEIQRAGTGDDAGKLLDLVITKDIEFYAGNQKVPANHPEATPSITYIVTRKDTGEPYKYNTLNALYENVLNPK